MKTTEEIQSRLLKLRKRHLSNYISKHNSRLPHNCIHNYNHLPAPLPNISDIEEKSVPRRSVSLIIIQEEKPIRICTYGSNDPANWNGDICDSELVSANCPYFTPSKEQHTLSQEFDEILSNDQKTLQEYPDVAALQWVLNDRVSRMNWSFKIWWVSLLMRITRYFRSWA